jgi:DNA-directed RNA polymerase subunit E'/Rpb7
MKYIHFTEHDTHVIVNVLQKDLQGHCFETCGQTYVIYYYDDDEDKTLVISDSREFNLKYYPCKDNQ